VALSRPVELRADAYERQAVRTPYDVELRDDRIVERLGTRRARRTDGSGENQSRKKARNDGSPPEEPHDLTIGSETVLGIALSGDFSGAEIQGYGPETPHRIARLRDFSGLEV